ncbi:alkaline phosphatase D family protein [Woodsholea maritima]|uniref:alkaline phosphatase D family protein n=1 Tax=Woodsholea maritima TaxID=240237 RepID=UPI000370DDB1|nr:alkaline phosphatase D family protein [Woodsholea maritima]
MDYRLLDSLSRRTILRVAGAGAVAALASACKVGDTAGKPAFQSYPFALGVASGDPTVDGFVLWTRLAPNPLDEDGGMGDQIVDVAYEVAEDEGFTRIVRTGVERAVPGWGHAIHAEVYGLPAGRSYFYRFHAAGVASPVGRAHTAPAYGEARDRMTIAWVSCSHYEQGFFHAYQDVVAQTPDLIVHTGDHIYESSWGNQIRRHVTPEPFTLGDYRRTHALYRLDPDLQAAAAVAPWVMVWDDHEVDNDYAGDIAETPEVSVEAFRARRLAAYQAYWENMPLRRKAMLDRAHGEMRIWSQSTFGALASVYMTDGRQYRSPLACPTPDDRGGQVIPTTCEDLADDSRTYLGSGQEGWLRSQFGRTGARWNIIVQPTLFSDFTYPTPDGGSLVWSDGWGGYPAARQRLVDLMASREGANPILLGGDTHCNWVSDIKADYLNPNSATVGSEFVTTSITSGHGYQDVMAANVPNFPHIKHFDGRERGYGLLELFDDRAEVSLRVVEDVTRRDGNTVRNQAKFVIEAGQPGPVSMSA